MSFLDRAIDRLMELFVETTPPMPRAGVIAWPVVPDAWIVDYCVWRINSGKLGDRPSSIPGNVPLYADQVCYWCIWRRKGRPDPRPSSFPAKIPKWGYETLDGVNKRAPVQIPSVLHPWVQTWAIERFKGTAEVDMPPSVPKDVTVVAPYVWSVLNWLAWQRKRFSNPAAPRPKNIPAAIPPVCWDLLKIVNRAVPLGPPPPPPPPPGPPKPPNTWRTPFPVMYVSWGPQSDSQYRDNDEAYARMRQAGVATVLFQVSGGQALFNPDAPVRARRNGLRVGVWGIADPGDEEILAMAQAEAYVPQVETPDQYQLLMNNMRAGVGRGLSLSCVSTLYGFNNFIRRAPTELHPEGELTTSEYEAMREYITHGMIECYVQEGGAHFPIVNMMFAAGQRGFDYFNPVIGMYHESSFNQYRPSTDPNSLDSWGKQIGVYLSEGMTTANWVELANLGT